MTGATRKQKEKKKFSLLKCIQKSNVIKKKFWVLVFSFMYLVLVDAMDWSLVYTFSPFFYFQSEAFTGEGEVTFYDADDLDIQWYGRQCSRFQRNITLPGEEEKYSDILGRQKLNKEYPG